AAGSLVSEPIEAQPTAAARYGLTSAERAAGVTVHDDAHRPGAVERYLAGADAASAFLAAIAQAQQVRQGISIGAPLTVSTDLSIGESITLPAAQVTDGLTTKAMVPLTLLGGSISVAPG